MRTDAEGVADRAAMELGRVKAEISGLTTAFATGEKESNEYRSGITSLTGELRFWSDTQKLATESARDQAAANAIATGSASDLATGMRAAAEAVKAKASADRDAIATFNKLTPLVTIQAAELQKLTAAAAAADPEWRRLQQTLGGMNAAVAQDAAEAIVLSRQSTNEAVQAWRERVTAEKAAVATAAQDAAIMKDLLREQAQAEKAAAQATREAAAIAKAALSEQAQAERDLAALHAALYAMEQRSASSDDAERARQHAIAGIVDQNAAIREAMALQTALGAMETRSANESAEAERRRADGLKTGTAAAKDAADATRQKADADREAVSTANKLAPITVIQASELQKLTDKERDAAKAASDLKAAQAAMGSGISITSQQIKDIKAALAQAETQVESLGSAFLAGKITADQFRAGVKHINEETAQIRSVANAMGSLNSRLNGINGTVRNLGYGLSDVFSNNGPLGQKIQGFSNNVSNITTGILQMFGKIGPGAILFAAALEVAFTGAGAAMTAFGIKTFEDLKNLFTGVEKQGVSSLNRLEARIEELTEKKHLIPIETLELENANRLLKEMKDNAQALERLKTSQTEGQQKSGQAVAKVFSEATDDAGNVIGSQGVVKALGDKLKAQMLANDSELQAAQGRVKSAEAEIERLKNTPIPAYDPTVADLAGDQRRNIAKQEAIIAAGKETAADRRLKIPDEAEKAIAGQFRVAEKGFGVEQETARKQLAREAKGAGLGKVAEELTGASPEMVKAQEERKKVDEKTAKLREILADADKSAAEIEQVMAESAGQTDKQLDATIHETQRRIKAEKDFKAAKDREDKALAASISRGVTDVNQAGSTDDIKAGAKADLVADTDPATVKSRMKTAIRKEIDAANKIPEAIRDAVSEAVSGEFVDSIGGVNLQKVRDQEIAKATAKGKKDKADLTHGLGPEFIATTEAARAGIETDQNMTPRQRNQARSNFDNSVPELARRKLIQAGVEPERARDLGAQAPALIQGDMQKQIDVMRLNRRDANVANGLPRNQGADIGSLMRQLGNNKQMAMQQMGVVGGVQDNQNAMMGQLEQMQAQIRMIGARNGMIGRRVGNLGRGNQNTTMPMLPPG